MKIKLLLPLVLAVFWGGGCATHLTKPAKENEPSRVRFSQFERVEMKEVVISERFASSGPNQKAANKINSTLLKEMRSVFPNLTIIESGKEFSKQPERTLQISPIILEIKFIGGAARFWVGALAGSSAVLAQVTYVDSMTGKEIAKPQFYRDAGAMSGGWSLGTTDNLMLDNVAMDIVRYSTVNR